MRIITGEFRGRKLISPPTKDVRPTTDRVKEAIFSILAPEIADAVVLDLFAGSGSLGIEAISRGAKHVYFCDNSEKSISVIRQNIVKLGISDRVTIANCDFKRISSRITKKVDIVLIDAPYNMCEYADILMSLKNGEFLADPATILIERDKSKGGYEVPAPFALHKVKKYGNTEVDILVYNE